MPKSSLWSEMPTLKNLLTAGRMIIKPFTSPALGVFLLSIAKGQLVGWLVPQAQSKAREVRTSILTICHITWRRDTDIIYSLHSNAVSMSSIRYSLSKACSVLESEGKVKI